MQVNNNLAIIGLTLDILGVVIMYYNTPSYNSPISDYDRWDNGSGISPKKSFTRKFTTKHGLILIIIGFFLQLSNLIWS
jgi:hypothetical protein